MLYSVTNKGNITIQIEKPLTGQKEKALSNKGKGKDNFHARLAQATVP